VSAERDRRLDELLAKQEIYERLCDYMRGQDRLDPVLHRSVFWDDARTHYGIYDGDADGFVAFAQAALAPHKSNHHLIGQVRIDLEGDVGFGEVYFTAFHRLEQEGEDRDLFVAGRYVDRYERRGGVWKIAFRAELVDWSRNDPASDSFLTASPESLLGARGSEDLSSQRERVRYL
jgi:hypothetical protein